MGFDFEIFNSRHLSSLPAAQGSAIHPTWIPFFGSDSFLAMAGHGSSQRQPARHTSKQAENEGSLSRSAAVVKV
jgi:hypothetical protein